MAVFQPNAGLDQSSSGVSYTNGGNIATGANQLSNQSAHSNGVEQLRKEFNNSRS